jgi:hypothetical protein
MDLLKGVDSWFLVLVTILLGGYFLWSVNGLFSNLQVTITELKLLIKELFQDRNDHESRINALETRCDIMHGNDPRPGGRRYYDPEHPTVPVR